MKCRSQKEEEEKEEVALLLLKRRGVVTSMEEQVPPSWPSKNTILPSSLEKSSSFSFIHFILQQMNTPTQMELHP